jgi:hypothetical protein
MKKGAAKLHVLLVTESKMTGARSKNPLVKNNNTKSQKNVRVLPFPVQL